MGDGKKGVQVGSLVLGLTGENVLTDSARHEARAEEAKRGDGEAKKSYLSKADHRCGPGGVCSTGQQKTGRVDHLLHLKCQGFLGTLLGSWILLQER